MTITVSIEDTTLAELLAKIEAGEEIILVRDDVPVARMAGVATQKRDTQDIIDTIIRERSTRKPVTQAEIAEWKQIGRR
ncbi:type II toxin-antitoxin system prevent-host-death family antitoxin [Rhizobium sp. OAE497]|jgi:antitoxin (DNA-binding transcriptional repressor) of toxin-antitoxin stability system|uniref:type II toxin-antitoxin system prevent-host-death family antitoxin n=1 Tax=Rhizobium sp. OAE497 TaxID=2663796 RepID=UPI000DDC1F53